MHGATYINTDNACMNGQLEMWMLRQSRMNRKY